MIICCDQTYSKNRSIYRSIYRSIFLPIHPSSTVLSFHPSVHPLFYRSICPSIHFSIVLSFYRSIHPLFYHSISSSIHSSICPSIHCSNVLSFYRSIHPLLYRSIHWFWHSIHPTVNSVIPFYHSFYLLSVWHINFWPRLCKLLKTLN